MRWLYYPNLQRTAELTMLILKQQPVTMPYWSYIYKTISKLPRIRTHATYPPHHTHAQSNLISHPSMHPNPLLLFPGPLPHTPNQPRPQILSSTFNLPACHSSPNPPPPPLKNKVQHNRHKQRRAEDARSPLIVVLGRLPRPDRTATVQVNCYSVAQREDRQQGESGGGKEGAAATTLVTGAKVEEGDGYGADVDWVFELLRGVLAFCPWRGKV